MYHDLLKWQMSLQSCSKSDPVETSCSKYPNQSSCAFTLARHHLSMLKWRAENIWKPFAQEILLNCKNAKAALNPWRLTKSMCREEDAIPTANPSAAPPSPSVRDVPLSLMKILMSLRDFSQNMTWPATFKTRFRLAMKRMNEPIKDHLLFRNHQSLQSVTTLKRFSQSPCAFRVAWLCPRLGHSLPQAASICVYNQQTRVHLSMHPALKHIKTVSFVAEPWKTYVDVVGMNSPMTIFKRVQREINASWFNTGLCHTKDNWVNLNTYRIDIMYWQPFLLRRDRTLRVLEAHVPRYCMSLPHGLVTRNIHTAVWHLMFSSTKACCLGTGGFQFAQGVFPPIKPISYFCVWESPACELPSELSNWPRQTLKGLASYNAGLLLICHSLVGLVTGRKNFKLHVVSICNCLQDFEL